MIIDAHAHACGEFADLEQLIKILDKFGVDKVALCPGLKGHTSAPSLPNIPISAIKQHPLYSRYFINPGIRFNYNFLLKEKQDGNQFVHSMVEECPDRIIQIYWVDPRAPNFTENIERDFKRWNFRGVKLHQVCTSFKSDGPEMKQVVEFAEEKRLPIFIHLWSNKEASKLVELVKRHSGTDFILLHLLGLEVFSKYAHELKNIYFDISPYSYISEERLRQAVDTFSADHVVFGSDTPFDGDSLSKVMERVKKLDLSDNEKGQILGENMAKILQL